MTENKPEMTPTLETAAEIRADLHQALVETEDAIAAAAAGRFLEWAEDVQKALTHLHFSFHDHIEVAEGVDDKEGLYDEVLDREPRLRQAVLTLKGEHPAILAAIHEPYHRLKERKPDEFIPYEEIRDSITAALARITKHRMKGADLVWETYYVDLGGLD